MFEDIGAITDADIDIIENDFRVYAKKSDFSFNEERRFVLRALNSIDVNACPGSGKTTMIAAKLLILAKKWPYKRRGVCVLSHTNVAKDEITRKLKLHPYGHQLLEYPHFIGTIQEFVTRFLASPYMCSKGINDFRTDNDEYLRCIWNRLEIQQEFSWFKGTMNGLGSKDKQDNFLLQTYYYLLDSNKIDINISNNSRAWTAGKNFQEAKKSYPLYK